MSLGVTVTFQSRRNSQEGQHAGQSTADVESLLPILYLPQIRMFTSLLANAGVWSVWFGEVVCGSNGHELVTPNRVVAEDLIKHLYHSRRAHVQTIISLLPEPAATAFAVAAFMGLRHGEIQGLLWENYQHGQLYVIPKST